MHIAVSKVSSIGSDNDLSADRHQNIIWIGVEMLLIGFTVHEGLSVVQAQTNNVKVCEAALF